MMKGKDGKGIIRVIDLPNKRITFKKSKDGGGNYDQCYGTLGYLSNEKITKCKVKFNKA